MNASYATRHIPKEPLPSRECAVLLYPAARESPPRGNRWLAQGTGWSRRAQKRKTALSSGLRGYFCESTGGTISAYFLSISGVLV